MKKQDLKRTEELPLFSAKEYNMKENLLKILSEACPGVDFENETGLVDNGIIESLDLVAIVADIIDEFGVDLTVDDLTPENFNSLEGILALIESKK